MVIGYCRSGSIFNESRSTKEIIALLQAGYNVEVFGWDRDGEAYNKNVRLFSEYKDKVAFHFYKGRAGKSNINKVFDRIKWAVWLAKAIRKAKNVQVIHACDFDTAFPVFLVNKNHSRKMVYDIYDYYIDAHPVPGPVKNIIEKLDHKIINTAQCVIICTEERREQIKGTEHQKLLVIYNSPEINRLDDAATQYDYCYCGALNDGRLVSEIVDQYENDSNLRFFFAGTGKYSDKLKTLDKSFDEFTFAGSITYDQVLNVEKKTKVLSAIYDPSKRNHQLCAPNKFYEALALGKPVIVVRNTGIDKLVEEYQIGKVINYNASEFFQALKYLISHDDECKKMGIRARRLYEDRYQWSDMKKILVNMYSEL